MAALCCVLVIFILFQSILKRNSLTPSQRLKIEFSVVFQCFLSLAAAGGNELIFCFEKYRPTTLGTPA